MWREGWGRRDNPGSRCAMARVARESTPLHLVGRINDFTVPPRPCWAQVSLEAVHEAVGSVKEVHFVLYGQPNYDAYVKAAVALGWPETDPPQ